MKTTLLGITMVLGVLAAAPSFAYGRGGGFHGGAAHTGGGYHGGYGGGFHGGYGGGFHGGYGGYRGGYAGRPYVGGFHGGGYYRGPVYRGYGYRRWMPGYRLTTPYCVAYPLDPACVVAGYWAY
jgi:hypothetical protein